MGGPDRVRDRVVDIAALGGLVAVGKSARQVAAQDEPLHRDRRPVAGFGGQRIGGKQRADLGAHAN